jgi:hypothetical protein
MATEIEELKELVRRNIALAEDTNHTIHKMYRATIWGKVFNILWFLSVLGLTGFVYYYFLAPYLGNIMELYSQAQNVLQNSPFR